MSLTRYCCTERHRLEKVRAFNAQSPAPARPLNGIDYLEVATADQRTLSVRCLLSPAGLTPQHCRVEGGSRIKGVQVTQVLAPTAANELRLRVDAAGDFSTYTLRLVDPASPDKPAAGFDPRLAEIPFSFKAQCPSDFDCAPAEDCPAAPEAKTSIDYLAKDFESFRGLMLDRLGVLVPGFAERSPADLQVALVELLAYAGDQLSYQQDAVATEAYLGTARSRVSLRRHARLLDYALHDGCNARAWVAIEVTKNGTTLPAGTRLLTRGAANDSIVPARDVARELDGQTLVFQTLTAASPRVAHGRIPFYAWSDEACWLPAGATRATLVDAGLTLGVGDVLLFEEVVSPDTGLRADADPGRRHAVRLTDARPSSDPLTGTALLEINWAEADALPTALCLSARVGAQGILTVDISVARGNVVLVDHGDARVDRPLAPAGLPAAGPYRPRLLDAGLASREDPKAALEPGVPASAMLAQDPRRALPIVTLVADDGTIWGPVRDLLESDRFEHLFVVEIENDGRAALRFGDGRHGLAPGAGAVLRASYRLGGGLRGNVGAESITRVVTDDPALRAAKIVLRNPLPAVGGQDPESAEQVRQYAPQAFRTQERAVTEDDYARAAQRFGDVQRAAARLRWTGSWYTVYVTVDRKGGRSTIGDATFNAALRAYLDRVRMAGHDLELRDPTYASLDLALEVCVRPDVFAADVEQALLRRFGTGQFRGSLAFFHPDNFSFGDPLYLSRFIEAALEVSGVASVRMAKFQRWGRLPNGELDAEVIQAAPLEVLRLDNDPSFPENGRIVLEMKGGL